MARTGFEPVVSALRGQRPGPLDERAVEVYLNIFPSENGFFREYGECASHKIAIFKCALLCAFLSPEAL